MLEEAPNVVTEDGLRRLLADGYLMEVICRKAGEKRHNTWYGNWIVRAVSDDRRPDRLLVTSRSNLKIREFKTIIGLVSLLSDMGCTTASIPLEEGGRARHVAPGHPTPSRTDPSLSKDD